MIAFFGSFLQYFIILVILAALGVGGIFLGKTLRKKKDAKDAVAAPGTNE